MGAKRHFLAIVQLYRVCQLYFQRRHKAQKKTTDPPIVTCTDKHHQKNSGIARCIVYVCNACNIYCFYTMYFTIIQCIFYYYNIIFISINYNEKNLIGSVMVSVLVLSAVDRGFELRSGQTKYFEIGICCFSTWHAPIMIMCPSGEICLSANCCFSELPL